MTRILKRDLVTIVVAIGVASVFTGCATVKTKDELSDTQIAALEESQGRVIVYRQRLGSLEKERAANVISGREYAKRIGDLRTLTRLEVDFQRAIVTKDGKISVIAQDLQYHIGKGAEAAPEFLGRLAVGCLLAFAERGGTISVH